LGNTAFRVGQWRVDSARNEISRDGTTVKIEPRTMRVLVCLAERAGEVVSGGSIPPLATIQISYLD
jgi:DNA-binding winged helix-turn-helix (wHTH) protein